MHTRNHHDIGGGLARAAIGGFAPLLARRPASLDPMGRTPFPGASNALAIPLPIPLGLPCFPHAARLSGARPAGAYLNGTITYQEPRLPKC